MRRRITVTIAAAALALILAFPAGAGARTNWVCTLPSGETVTFVSAADAAHHGIETANRTAGTVFRDQFGESCHVE